MPTPEFILELRERVGTMPLWLSGVTAVVVRPTDDADAEVDEILVIRRADNGRWAPVAGIIEPGEHPADTAEREIAEEAGIVAEVEQIAGIDVSAQVEYENGDSSRYLVVVVRCRWISGDPYPVDGEALEVRWVRLDRLEELDPPLGEASLRRIGWAVSDEQAAAFRRAP
jgi:8-oxo-dGTP pyrophosphatase MutT (NUDIX family)